MPSGALRASIMLPANTAINIFRTPSAASPDVPAVSSRRPVVLLALITVAIVLEHTRSPRSFWPWLLVAVMALGLILWLRTTARTESRRRWITWLASLAVISTTVAWTIQRDHRVEATSIAQLASSTPSAFRFRATITTQPAIRSPQRGQFSHFGYLEPQTIFRAEVWALVDREGRVIPATGRVLVRLREADYTLTVGQSFEAFGLLRAFPPALNPGDNDLAKIARVQGLGGIVDIAARQSIDKLDTTRTATSIWRRWQAKARLHAAGWIRQDLPDTPDTRREALLAAILLGDRGGGLDGLDDSFKRVGLAHLLAISGLHLGILTVTFVILLRLTCPYPNLSRLLVIALVLIYLFLVPARIPIWRAGVMILVFTVASARGRRLDALNVWALSAIVVLLWWPYELFSPGAQLSFGIVLAFILIARSMRERLWGLGADVEQLSIPEYAFDLLKTLGAITLLAYLVSTPLIAHHFGVYCPIGPVAAFVAAPLAALTLAVGFVKIITAALYPSLGVILAPVLALSADGLIGLVDRLDQLPWSSVPVIQPGALWTLVATALMVWWIRWPLRGPAFRSVRRLRLVLLIVLFAWPLRASWPVVGTNRPDSIEIAMLAVGDGSCILVRSGEESVLFDAGSGTDYEIGASTIVPTLRQLGVFHVSTIYLSHGDLDHFSGALDVIDEFGVARVVLNSSFIRQARGAPFGPPAFLIEQLEQRGLQIDTVSTGYRETVGQMQLTFLHPRADGDYSASNESSSVVRIEAMGRRILLTGDLQGRGFLEVMKHIASEDLRADILELPHHGSWSDQAVAFVEQINPRLVLQSTGPTRLVLDRWATPLADRTRFVTARDGMIRIIIGRDGSIRAESFLNGPIGVN